MKKSFLTLMIAALLFLQPDFKLNAQSVKEGNFIIEGAYGFPYVAGTAMRAVYVGIPDLTGVTFRNTNHLMGRFEYMVSDNIGIAGEYSYANAFFRFTDSTGSYQAGIKKHRILGNIVIHFATTDNLDPYVIVGAGYKDTDFYVNGPTTNYDDDYNIKLYPVSFRAGVGLRYYFNDFIGLRGEIGIGGPVACAGISLKF